MVHTYCYKGRLKKALQNLGTCLNCIAPLPLPPCWGIVFWESLKMSWPPLPPLQLGHFLKLSFIYLNLPFRCFIDFSIPNSLFFLFGNTLRLKFVHIWSSPCLYLYSLRCGKESKHSIYLYIVDILNLTWINLACDIKSWGKHFQWSSNMGITPYPGTVEVYKFGRRISK